MGGWGEERVTEAAEKAFALRPEQHRRARMKRFGEEALQAERGVSAKAQGAEELDVLRNSSEQCQWVLVSKRWNLKVQGPVDQGEERDGKVESSDLNCKRLC